MKAAYRSLPLFLALVLVAGAARAGTVGGDSPRTQRPGVGGRVLGEASPLAAAGVYAYQLADLSVRKVLTDNKGSFLFQDLPAGLYKIIAHKPGFVPVVVMLTRTAAQNYQFVELQLTERPLGKANPEDDFWSVRSRIPGDVLRDIEEGDGPQTTYLGQLAPLGDGQRLDLAKTGFRTEMQAMTGVDQIAAVGGGQVSGAGLGIKGTVGDVQIGLRGNFWSLSGDPVSVGGPGVGGQASALSLDLSHGSSSRFTVSSLSNRLVGGRGGEGREMEPIDFEHYKVNWTQEVGEKGRSEVSAQYTAENNYHRQGPISPLAIPEASQTFWVEGAYTTALGDRNMLQTGLRYRERQFGLGAASPRRPEEMPVSQSIDAFSRGGVRVRPAVLLEYGLYSTLSDGSLSLMPQGGIVLQLGANWQVQGNASYRAYEDTRLDLDFLPSLFEESDLCEQGSSACYQVGLSRQLGEDESLSFSATHREIGETLRLYFSNDLFDRSESLYLVRGDELPEMRVELTKKLSSHVLARLESSLATGGGGTFLAADRRSYENQIRYLVTSLDTQFLGSQTGVFVAFHQLSQELQPLDGRGPSAQVDLERLRLQLTQDLGFLMDLAKDWAVQLNMELSRGPMSADSNEHDNELRRRLMGGIAVKF